MTAMTEAPSPATRVITDLPGEPAGAAEIYLPFRVIAVGEGVREFQSTLLRQPTLDDAAFGRDARWIVKDLLRARAGPRPARRPSGCRP